MNNKNKIKKHLCQMYICDKCLKNNKNNNIEKNNNEKMDSSIKKQDIVIKNENISSERKISNNIKINVLNNQTNPKQVNQINNYKSNISFTVDKKKVCCDCCVTY
jgi:hypothetical protein